MKNKKLDGVCLVCLKVNINLDVYMGDFDCDGEYFGLCGKIYILIMC